MTTPDQNGHRSPRLSGSEADALKPSDTLSAHEIVARPVVEGYVATKVRAAHVRETTLVAARIDPFGASQYEVGCELELGDGSRISITIDVDTATTLGRILIAQAALSWKAGDNEIDAHMRRYARSARARPASPRTH